MQNTCSEPQSTEPTNTEHSNLTTMLLISCGILALILLGAGIGWKLRYRISKNDSNINPKRKNPNQEAQLPNSKADASHDSTAVNLFEAPPLKHSQMLSSNQLHSPAAYPGEFLQVHADMGGENNEKADKRSDDSKEFDHTYLNQFNLQQKDKLSAHDDEHYVNIDVTARQAHMQSRSRNEEYYKNKSKHVHTSLYKAENYYNVTSGSDLNYNEKEESLYAQPMNCPM